MTYEEHLKQQEEENQRALAGQSAQSAAVEANAIGSAMVGAANTQASATSGGMTNPQVEYQPVITQPQAVAQTSATTPGADGGSDLDKASRELDRANEDYIQEVGKAREAQDRAFSDMVFDYHDRMMREQREMKKQEQANMMSSMASGTTELAAGIINLLGVGELHASNQQYKSFSQDWMRKADQDMREHRARQHDMYDTLQRLKMQQEQVRRAGRVEDMRAKQQQAQNAYNIAVQQRQYEDARKDREWQQQQQEKQFERQAKQTDASIAQGWARITQAENKFNAELAMRGYNPDGTPNMEYQKQLAEVKALASGGGGNTRSSLVSYNILDMDGKPNVAQMQPKEMEDLLVKAQVAIANDLGEQEQDIFNTELQRAIRMGDDKEINSVLARWMGKSATCEQMIRNIDENYKGRHGAAAPRQTSGYNGNQQQQNNANPRTGLGGYN